MFGLIPSHNITPRIRVSVHACLHENGESFSPSRASIGYVLCNQTTSYDPKHVHISHNVIFVLTLYVFITKGTSSPGISIFDTVCSPEA